MGIAGNLTCDCSSGLILPLINECDWSDSFRAFVYLLGLLYSFLGIAIAADVFMCAIERITRVTRRVRVMHGGRGVEGATVEYEDQLVWNPTVANLTLMALGSSAPEILLSVIELVGNGMTAGDLGPSTIVGSAAYNLLLITALCISSIPGTAQRKIAQLNVFLLTSCVSIFAYIWLLIVLVGTSANVVEIWEAVLTFLFFILLVVGAYIIDVQPWKSRQRASSGTALEMNPLTPQRISARPDAWKLMRKNLLRANPQLSPAEVANKIASAVHAAAPHDRLYYRIQATRWLDGVRQKLWALPERNFIPAPLDSMDAIDRKEFSQIRKTIVEFSAKIYGVNKDATSVNLKIIRWGLAPDSKLAVRYFTVGGLAQKTTHFLDKAETVIFEPGQTEKIISIKIIRGYDWFLGVGFFVHLSLEKPGSTAKLGLACPAVVRYDNAIGIPEFQFLRRNFTVVESDRLARLPVQRISGVVSSLVGVSWKTKDASARNGRDYIGATGCLRFEPGEVLKFLDIGIIDDLTEERSEVFLISLGEISDGAHLGTCVDAAVTILSDDGICDIFREIDELVPRKINALEPGWETWRQQILQATSVNGGHVSDATGKDVIIHVLAFPFKAFFSLVPPPIFLGGWPTFFIALALIGLLTAVVGDLAAIFGCLIGLKPFVTAITLVAIGTSLPDSFASRLAALQDKTADNAIGNVNGSNSVNVFVGLGIPWIIGSVYWKIEGRPFDVPADNLAFSVCIYTIASVLCLTVLLLRRFLPCAGKSELGGPALPKYISTVFLVSLWISYILLSVLQAYGHIPGF